jgi:hypothetical protein
MGTTPAGTAAKIEIKLEVGEALVFPVKVRDSCQDTYPCRSTYNGIHFILILKIIEASSLL